MLAQRRLQQGSVEDAALDEGEVADELAVGGIVRRSVPLLVAEDGRLGQSLLGMNFIGTLSGFELRGDRLILRD